MKELSLISALKKKLLKDKSLRKTVVRLVIAFTLVFAFAIAVISSATIFNMKINSMSYNQQLFLKQVQVNINRFVTQVEEISTYLSSNHEKIDSILENVININPLIKTVIIIDKDGKLKNLYTNEKKEFFKTDDFTHKVYKNIKDNSPSSWSGLLISKFNNRSYVSYNFNINTDTVIMLVSLDNLTLLTNGLINSDKSFMIRIFDKSGYFILNEDKPELAKTKFNASSSDVFTKLINVKKEYEIAKFKNICYGTLDYGMYASIDKTNWDIVVRQNYDVVQSYLFNLILSIILTILVFTIIAVYITKAFLQNVFNSLDKFEKQTSNIANGHYEEELHPTYFKELNKLSSSIVKMKNKIHLREDNLIESLKSFRVLINSTMEGIIIHDSKVCIDINDMALKILGYENKDDVIGEDIYKHIKMKHKKDGIKYFQKNKIFSKPREYELITNDNRHIIVLAQGRVLKNTGRTLRISAFMDITNIKKQQKLLFQQAKMASIGEMLSNIAHQWRQPLSTIRTISSGIKLEKELGVFNEDKLMTSLDKINESTIYLSKIIDEFSSYFNPNKEIEVFDLVNIINKTLNFLEPALKSNDIKIVANFDDEIFIKGYPSELTQALLNIFNNSKDALILNNIEEKVILIDSYKQNKKAVITIKDSALGIDNSKLSKIFEPYYTTKHKAKGIGIGLYMAHQIVTEHMRGMVYAKNSSFTYKDKDYEGLEIILEFKL